MTLSQRLTRAGLVFVLLGSVAAVLPQQNGAAQATTGAGLCNGVTRQYAFGDSSTDSNTSATVVQNSFKTLTAFEDGNPTTNVGFSLSNSAGYTSAVSGSSITVTNTGATTLTAVTATFLDTNTALMYTINP